MYKSSFKTIAYFQNKFDCTIVLIVLKEKEEIYFSRPAEGMMRQTLRVLKMRTVRYKKLANSMEYKDIMFGELV